MKSATYRRRMRATLTEEILNLAVKEDATAEDLERLAHLRSEREGLIACQRAKGEVA